MGIAVKAGKPFLLVVFYDQTARYIYNRILLAIT
jgi:hypothetical protein